MISAGEWPQTYALDHVVTGTGIQASSTVLNTSGPCASTGAL